MSTFKFKRNHAGVRDLLRSGAAEDACRQVANQVAKAAGPGFEVETELGRNRARAAVIPRTRHAREAEAKYRQLTKAMLAARIQT